MDQLSERSTMPLKCPVTANAITAQLLKTAASQVHTKIFPAQQQARYPVSPGQTVSMPTCQEMPHQRSSGTLWPNSNKPTHQALITYNQSSNVSWLQVAPKLSTRKTILSPFHLCNRKATRELCGQQTPAVPAVPKVPGHTLGQDTVLQATSGGGEGQSKGKGLTHPSPCWYNLRGLCSRYYISPHKLLYSLQLSTVSQLGTEAQLV